MVILPPADAASIGIRPEGLRPDPDAAHFTGDVILHEALGAETILTVEMREPVLADPPRLLVRLPGNGGPAEGKRVALAIDPHRLNWFDTDGRAVAV